MQLVSVRINLMHKTFPIVETWKVFWYRSFHSILLFQFDLHKFFIGQQIAFSFGRKAKWPWDHRWIFMKHSFSLRLFSFQFRNVNRIVYAEREINNSINFACVIIARCDAFDTFLLLCFLFWETFCAYLLLWICISKCWASSGAERNRQTWNGTERSKSCCKSLQQREKKTGKKRSHENGNNKCSREN